MPYIMKKHTKNSFFVIFLCYLQHRLSPPPAEGFSALSSGRFYKSFISWLLLFDHFWQDEVSAEPVANSGCWRDKGEKNKMGTICGGLHHVLSTKRALSQLFFKHVCRYPYLKLKFLLSRSQCSSHDAFKDHRHHIITWLYSNFVVEGLFTLAALTQAICHSVVISLHIFSAMLYRGNYTLFWSFPVTGGEQDCFEEWEQNCSW